LSGVIKESKMLCIAVRRGQADFFGILRVAGAADTAPPTEIS
jgi:hypothetical protein